MEIAVILAEIIFILALVGGFLVLTYRAFSPVPLFILFAIMGRNPFKYFAFRYRRLTPEQESYLSDFIYYQSMPPSLKRIFQHRLNRFMDKKKFISPAGFEITEEVKTMVSASAIQLTFGMTNYSYKSYDTLIIHPSSYFSPVTGKYHLGEVNPKGAIVLSWEDFNKGYEDPFDNRNLGLHEFAHALFLNVVHGRDEDIRLTFHFDEFRKEGDVEFFRMRKENNGYLRDYAATNLMEFFAVSVEHFFEAPNAMKKSLPGLYKSMTRILGQDPSRWLMA